MEDGEKKYGPNLAIPFRDTGGEKLLQFIWQFGYYNSSNLTTTEGEKLTVIFPGTLNPNAGPDFANAKMRIGETTFFGSVELHLKTSDWERHQHENDAAYRNVILHVVFHHDKDLPHKIPVVELEPRISTLLLDHYFALLNAETFIPCSASIAQVKDIVWVGWKERLLVERLTRKAGHILALLAETNHHWEEVLWWLLAGNFGGKINREAFEAMAKSISINVLAKHKASLPQIEALLFGQAGLLEGTFEEDYPQLLQREYQYLRKKWSLLPITIPLQFLRMRPVAFPTVRLAQLAVLVQQSQHLFSRIIEAKSLDEIRNLFHLTANDYWHYHYTFQQASSYKPKSLGADMVDNIIINTIIPVLFAYGLEHRDESFQEKAIGFLDEVTAEKNTITKGFSQLGIKLQTAYDSQALIELKNEYCNPKKCLQCAAGNDLLKKDVLPPFTSTRPASI